jgi:hypothetical protein
METYGIKYEFNAKPWQYNGANSWVFVSLPSGIAKEIRNYFKNEEEGWGRLKATAQIGDSIWKTAIWFDTKLNTYLLPLKAAIRKKELIEIDKNIAVIIWI